MVGVNRMCQEEARDKSIRPALSYEVKIIYVMSKQQMELIEYLFGRVTSELVPKVQLYDFSVIFGLFSKKLTFDMDKMKSKNGTQKKKQVNWL